MAVHDGAAHLPAQLDSLAAQTHTDWHLIASDDRPGDGSAAALQAFAAGAGRGRVTCLQGPGQGVAANFMFCCDIWLKQTLILGFWPSAIRTTYGCHTSLRGR